MADICYNANTSSTTYEVKNHVKTVRPYHVTYSPSVAWTMDEILEYIESIFDVNDDYVRLPNFIYHMFKNLMKAIRYQNDLDDLMCKLTEEAKASGKKLDLKKDIRGMIADYHRPIELTYTTYDKDGNAVDIKEVILNKSYGCVNG